MATDPKLPMGEIYGMYAVDVAAPKKIFAGDWTAPVGLLIWARNGQRRSWQLSDNHEYLRRMHAHCDSLRRMMVLDGNEMQRDLPPKNFNAGCASDALE